MTASHRNLTVFLRRAGVFTAVLAIIAGIFGMHVVTGAHSMPSPAAVMAATDGAHAGSPAAAEGTAFYQTSGTTRAYPATDIRGAAVTSAQMCSCSVSCTGMRAMTGFCIPSVKTGSLAALSLGTTVFGTILQTGAAVTVRGDWSYFPGTPSPGELSISRT